MIQSLIFVTIIAITFMVLFIVTYVKYQALKEEILEAAFELAKKGFDLEKELKSIKKENKHGKRNMER